MTTIDEIVAMDIDSHEMTPLHLWGTTFGPNFGTFGDMILPTMARFGSSANNFDRPGLTDDLPITPEVVWHDRGPGAPGAFDIARRLEVLQAMGTARQLVFPSGAVAAYGALLGPEYRQAYFPNRPFEEYEPILQGLLEEYNDWVVRQTARQSDRIRFVALLDAPTPADVIDKAETLADKGIRAFHIPCGVPLGNVSPADRALDGLWKLAEGRRISIVTHVGSHPGFTASAIWNKAPEFSPLKVESTEFGLEPYSMSVVHFPAASLISALVMGGVFERFPELRFGAIEFGGYWLGNLAETLDLWAANIFRKRMESVLSMRPSEYLARNVRVTPFSFEDIAMYFQRFPSLATCFAYASDYPHVEGGINQKQVCLDKIAPLGSDIVGKFFVENGSLLLPE
jgi:predicted TIM-barrel fold metal-dependent hydrolase